jgi:hypothetical protein
MPALCLPPPLQAISGLTVLGGNALAGPAPGSWLPGNPTQWLAAAAVFASTINIAGGACAWKGQVD